MPTRSVMPCRPATETLASSRCTSPERVSADPLLTQEPHEPPEPDCPRCGHAFSLMSHDFTGEVMGRECLTCDYAEDMRGHPII